MLDNANTIKLIVAFENIQHGWVDLLITLGDEIVFQESFSDTPYDSFGDLVTALRVLSQDDYDISKSVIFNSEPLEYTFEFRKVGKQIILDIVCHKGIRRIVGSDAGVFSYSGKYNDVFIPFWRGVRRFQSRYSSKELSGCWRWRFPGEEMDRLTRIIKSQ